MKRYLQLWILLFALSVIPACKKPASTDALKRTNTALEANSFHDKEQDQILSKLHDYVFGVQPKVTEPLIENGEKIYDASTGLNEQYLGIFTWQGFVGGLLSTLENVEKGIQVTNDVMGGNPYTAIALAVLGLATTVLGKMTINRGTVIAENKEERAKEKEIEHEADKIIPVDDHERWDNAVKIAEVKVLSKKKGLS